MSRSTRMGLQDRQSICMQDNSKKLQSNCQYICRNARWGRRIACLYIFRTAQSTSIIACLYVCRIVRKDSRIACQFVCKYALLEGVAGSPVYICRRTRVWLQFCELISIPKCSKGFARSQVYMLVWGNRRGCRIYHNQISFLLSFLFKQT